MNSRFTHVSADSTYSAATAFPATHDPRFLLPAMRLHVRVVCPSARLVPDTTRQGIPVGWARDVTNDHLRESRLASCDRVGDKRLLSRRLAERRTLSSTRMSHVSRERHSQTVEAQVTLRIARAEHAVARVPRGFCCRCRLAKKADHRSMLTCRHGPMRSRRYSVTPMWNSPTNQPHLRVRLPGRPGAGTEQQSCVAR